MHPRISIDGLSSFTWPLARDLAFARELGAHSITVAYAKLADDVPGAARAIAASGLRPVMLAGGAATGLMGGLASVQPSIDAARAIGCPAFYSVSGPAPRGASTDEAFEALAGALGPVVAHAGEQGIRVGIEHTSAATRSHGFVHSLADAAELAQRCGVDIVVELQNVWYERNLPRLFREHAARFALVQVSDFTVGESLRLNRRVPGDGDIPLEWLIGHLLEGGYAGLFDVEVLGPHIEAEGYESAIRRSVDWLSETLVRLGA
ncbi:sugar phosphate isomerase/epimerase family protein [Novosphingobium bradum]|uniref:Sugar phosphate isomerase/epimerase family protein n=1 Tax=Novosphingobium bradum TaxID=1737444 RepID=A0ABV7IMP0_9SPHN